MKDKKHDILKVEFKCEVPIENLTTYKTLGSVKGVFYPKNEKELILSYKFLKANDLPFVIIGNGSNLLISPKSNILAISTRKLKQNHEIIDNFATFSSSLPLAKAYSICVKNGLRGFESLAGIPATMGGAIKNNASAFGHSIFDNLKDIRIFKDGKISVLKKEDIPFSYHSTTLEGVILSASFTLSGDKPCKITQEFVNFQSIRQEKQPKGLCCGSVFKNPPNHSAGALIEKCGLKGTRQGGAIISQKHANFILNDNQATFDDVLYLIELCEKEVSAKFNIKLEREVEVIE